MIEAVETHATVADAAAALARPGARFLAGGTVAMRDANHGRFGAPRLVRCTDPALGAIRASGARVEIGSGVTLAEALESRDCAALHPVLRAVGGPAVREAATVGGNLFAPRPYGDLAAALIALDGLARMADGSERPVEEVVAERERAGLVAAVSVARPREGEFRFAKLARVKPKGVACMTVAAWLPGAPSRISGARVAWSGMADRPVRARATEAALEGARLDPGGIARALEVALEGLSPEDDALATAWWRREVAPVHLRRALLGEG